MRCYTDGGKEGTEDEALPTNVATDSSGENLELPGVDSRGHVENTNNSKAMERGKVL
jgi:hypothetical protein